MSENENEYTDTKHICTSLFDYPCYQKVTDALRQSLFGKPFSKYGVIGRPPITSIYFTHIKEHKIRSILSYLCRGNSRKIRTEVVIRLSCQHDVDPFQIIDLLRYIFEYVSISNSNVKFTIFIPHSNNFFIEDRQSLI